MAVGAGGAVVLGEAEQVGEVDCAVEIEVADYGVFHQDGVGTGGKSGDAAVGGVGVAEAVGRVSVAAVDPHTVPRPVVVAADGRRPDCGRGRGAGPVVDSQ